MAQDIVNKNQDISYTNLDFSSIYPEALELIKQLSYRWDPSISDESDPGVVLLKLSALIADKMNYNIDKSILEAFPLSVTQEENARQLYEQLGYYMNWYESATVPVNISWIGSNLSDEILYTIPKFTIITDSESSRSYALIGSTNNSNLVVSDGKLAGDGTTIQMIAMEGTPTVFSFLGETTITSQMVDEKNRLYFETKYVSQNGIFIKNIGNDQDNYLEWERVDNLYEQPYSDLRYKFGVDSTANVAYIEFPDNYAELIGSGIEIVYMIIEPDFSNIPPMVLDRFLVPFSPVEDSNVTLSIDNVKIENPFAATGHKNVESIDEAYVGYKRTVGTFKTLITLRDYLNYILQEGKELSSNGFVTDRSNDPQLSYKIMSTVNGMDSLITEIESDVVYTKENPKDATEEFKELRTPKLTPFSLKFYLLQDVIAVNSKNTFEQTFEMIESEDLPSLSALIDETAHIQHTYEDIITPDKNTYKSTTDITRDPNKSYYVKNEDRYDFIGGSYYTLIEDDEVAGFSIADPQPTAQTFADGDYYYYDDNTKTCVKATTYTADLTYYVSSNLITYYKYNVQYDIYYDAEVTSGEYVKGLYKLISVPSYVNPQIAGWYEINIPAISQHIAYFRAKYPLNITITTYSVVGTDVQADIKQNVLNALYQGLNSTQIEFGDRIELDYLTEIILAADSRIRTVVFDNIEYRIEAIYFDEIKGFTGIILPTEIAIPIYTDETDVKAYNIAKEIIAKSILAGTTKLLDKDTQFEYHLNQQSLRLANDIYSIESETIIDMANQTTVYVDGKINKNYTLQDNEVLTLLRPHLDNITTFANGINYEYLTYSTIPANTSYRLSKSEYLITYKSEVDTNGNIQGYTCSVYTNGAIIHPSFDLYAQNSNLALSEYFRTQIQPSLVSDDKTEYEFETTSAYWVDNISNNSSIINNVIQGSDTIVIQDMISINIVPEDGYKFYWILNEEKKAEVTGKKYYELFGEYNSTDDKDNNSEINSYTLKSGEVLYYIENSGKHYEVLTEGTTIIRNGGLNTQYTPIAENTLYSYIPITTDGITKLADIKPADVGYYEFNTVTNEYQVPAEETIIEGKTYYVIAMNSQSGYYEQHETAASTTENPIYDYTASPSITYTVFENADIDDTNLDEIDPSSNDFYEPVTYYGITIEDTYAAGKPTGGTDAYQESVAISRPRYKKSTDTKVYSEKVYEGIKSGFEINDITTYPGNDDQFNSIEINQSTITAYSPYWNNLYEAEAGDSPEYYTFYSDTSGTIVTPTVDSVPVAEGWYEKVTVNNTDTYVLSNKVYSYSPNTITKSTYANPFVAVNSANVGTGYKLYYTVGSNDTEYLLNNYTDKYIPIMNTFNSIPDYLYSSCLEQNVAGQGTINFTNLCANWSQNISNITPDEFYYTDYEFVYITSTDTSFNEDKTYYELSADGYIPTTDTSMQEGKTYYEVSSANGAEYYAVSLANLTSVKQYLLEYIGAYTIYPWINNSTETEYVVIPSGLYSSINSVTTLSGLAVTKIASYGEVDDFTDATTKVNSLITLWFKTVQMLGSKYAGLVALYLIPNYYRFRYLVSVDLSKYYKFKTYVDKSFGTLAPWECDVITADAVVNNPIRELQSYWKTLQDNCSLTIIKNDSYSLTTGDTISVTSNNTITSDVIASAITWPYFSNTPSILNLDNYSISYTKSNNIVTNLENMSIDGVSWKAYSNLLVNTSTDAGQKLKQNQRLTFFNNEGTQLLYIGSDADTTVSDIKLTDDNVVYQLQYPVNNQAGSHIAVETYDELGNAIPNSVYIYKQILGTDIINYSPTHETSVLITESNTQVPVPMDLPVGEYILPMVGNSDTEITINYSESVYKYIVGTAEDEATAEGHYYTVTPTAYYSDNKLFLDKHNNYYTEYDTITSTEYHKVVSESTIPDTAFSYFIVEPSDAIYIYLDPQYNGSFDPNFAYYNKDSNNNYINMYYAPINVGNENTWYVKDLTINNYYCTHINPGIQFPNFEKVTINLDEHQIPGLELCTEESEYSSTETYFSVEGDQVTKFEPNVLSEEEYNSLVQLMNVYTCPLYQQDVVPGHDTIIYRTADFVIATTQSNPHGYYTFNDNTDTWEAFTNSDVGTPPAYYTLTLIPCYFSREDGYTYYSEQTADEKTAYVQEQGGYFNSNTEYVTLEIAPVSLPVGTSLLGYYIEEYAPTTAADAQISIHNFYDEQETIFNEDKMYFLYINKVLDSNAALYITSTEEDITIVFQDIFKFNKNYVTNADETIYNEIFDQVKRLDFEHLYNYTYQPDANDLIENPLEPKMFWNKNHVFNTNTIAQLDTSSSDNISYRFITSR